MYFYMPIALEIRMCVWLFCREGGLSDGGGVFLRKSRHRSSILHHFTMFVEIQCDMEVCVFSMVKKI